MPMVLTVCSRCRHLPEGRFDDGCPKCGCEFRNYRVLATE